MMLDAPMPNASGRTGAISSAGRLVFWGTYDLGKPRIRILLEGLGETGAEVTEIHADVWSAHSDKSQMSTRELAVAFALSLLYYPVLLARFFRSPRDAIVVVPYPGVLDVLVLWPFAKLRGQQVIWDMFLSLFDTVVNDRKMASRRSPAGRLLFALEWLAARSVDCVLLDTDAHAAHVADLFGLPAGRTAAIPVGVEAEHFPRLAPARARAREGRTRVLFYGQLIPLHGVQTILDAALSERGGAFDWHIIGTGQDRPRIESALARQGAGHVTWEPWVPYENLIEAIGEADVCLGIFGASTKAACVVPNKVYQALLAGRTVITRDSPAIRETFGDAPGLVRIPHSDPDALLDAIDASAAAGFPAMSRDMLEIALPLHVGQRFEHLLGRISRTV
jgi:glycosyltransferase involved in cell wall biosynthesis